MENFLHWDLSSREVRLKGKSVYPKINLDATIKVRDLFNFIIAAFIVFVAVDLFTFVVWAVSMQTPEDNFFLGAFTTNVLKAIVG